MHFRSIDKILFNDVLQGSTPDIGIPSIISSTRKRTLGMTPALRLIAHALAIHVAMACCSHSICLPIPPVQSNSCNQLMLAPLTLWVTRRRTRAWCRNHCLCTSSWHDISQFAVPPSLSPPSRISSLWHSDELNHHDIAQNANGL